MIAAAKADAARGIPEAYRVREKIKGTGNNISISPA
jgi:hypothetical protein